MIARTVGLAALGAALAVSLALAEEPDRPPQGQSLLTELFPDGLPYPFAATLDALRTVAGSENVATALIPVGRSLQRSAAAPDFFASPRIVVAVTGDRAQGPRDPRLADRIFLGYQPASQVIEAISYNAAARRFEFEQVLPYAAGSHAEPASRAICLDCHQGGGPIFPRPLWTETNATPAIATPMAALGGAFEGAPVRQTVDALARFDDATDRAAALPVAGRLWSDGCPDAVCRAALLAAALRWGLSGLSDSSTPPEAAKFETHARTLWPEGLGAASPDLPNRNPLSLEAEDLVGLLETAGTENPETPRPTRVLWRPEDGFPGAARLLAGEFSPGDLAWIEALLRRHSTAAERIALPCSITTLAAETRFECRTPQGRASGFVAADGIGRIDGLDVSGQRLAAVSLPTALATPRLGDGRRVAATAFTGGALHIDLVDDFARLDAALLAEAEAGATPLGSGPFDRSALLRLIGQLLGGSDG